MKKEIKELFDVGQVTITDEVAEAIEESGYRLQGVVGKCLHLFQTGKWGARSTADDAKRNSANMKYGGRIIGKYDIGSRTLVIITEEDRSQTAIMFGA